MDKTTYNHGLDMGFSVPNSKYEDYLDCLKHEKEKVISALLKRVADLVDSDEFLEAIGGFDTFEEESLAEED